MWAQSMKRMAQNMVQHVQSTDTDAEVMKINRGAGVGPVTGE